MKLGNLKKINELRKSINSIDENFVKLLSERREISSKIVELKELGSKPIRDKKREQELLERIVKLAEEKNVDVHLIKKIFYTIIEDSIRIQQDYLQKLSEQNDLQNGVVRIAIQGIEGSYSYLSAHKFFSNRKVELSFVSYNRFEEVVQAVENGEADYAMLPIENTTSGGINEVYDLLLHTTLSIVGEEKFEVKHCLVTADNENVKSIKKIYAHYQAAAQCSNFIATLKDCRIEYFADTAMSVRKIAEEKNHEYAAIASKEASEIFNVKIIRENIANQTENHTRFIVCTRKPISVDQRIPCKTSLVLATAHTAGSLVDALSVFRKYDLNLTKLESRPVLGNPWEEMFYIDFEGNIDNNNIKEALEKLNPHTRFVKILGCYPNRDIQRTEI